MEGKRDDKRKRSDKSELDLCLKTSAEDELINKIPTLDEAIRCEMGQGNVSPNVDPKKFRRTISNRLSAQRVRLRESGYITKLEQKIKDLQNAIALMAPQIETVKGNQKMLRRENEMMQIQLDIATERSNLCTAQTEELKLELKRLKELAKAQEEEQMDQYLNFDAINFTPPNYDM
ncbi:hypothetical protein HAX54_052077 [Datura stramonium]|uniref:BZIP domain-containing protein n=1 Tax=Datura stramonium TaxID=4076 RepID=A0ABS8SZ69_DATST|nr:hypothetical protein [Datura stramonium]